MIPYEKDIFNKEVLNVAKEKYGVTDWVFTGREIFGEAWYNAEDVFEVKFYSEIYNAKFINGDNIENAMQAFAGKNGGHHIH